jgi:hypothetical protein
MIFAAGVSLSAGGISIMATNIRISSLVPAGLVVDGVAWIDGAMVLPVRPTGAILIRR